jgi:hypothetical protein
MLFKIYNVCLQVDLYLQQDAAISDLTSKVKVKGKLAVNTCTELFCSGVSSMLLCFTPMGYFMDISPP